LSIFTVRDNTRNLTNVLTLTLRYYCTSSVVYEYISLALPQTAEFMKQSFWVTCYGMKLLTSEATIQESCWCGYMNQADVRTGALKTGGYISCLQSTSISAGTIFDIPIYCQSMYSRYILIVFTQYRNY